MIQLLTHQFQHSNIRNILTLLVNPGSSCHFIPLFNSCVKIRSFEKTNNTAINIHFYHFEPKLLAYKIALCVPMFINKTFVINTAHNTKVYGNKALGNDVRKLTIRDYLVPNLPLVGVDMFLENWTTCSIIVCIQELSFLRKNEINSCKLGENITLCGEFSLTFEQGTVSHRDVQNQNLAAQLDINGEQSV